MGNLTYKEQVRALLKISQAVANELCLEDILRLVVEVTAEVMGSNICSILLVDNNTGELVTRATQSICEEYNAKPPLRFGEGIAGKVAQTNKYIVVKDVTREPEYKYHSLAKRAGLVSLLCMPLSIKGRVIGVLNCYTSRAHDFSETQINILSSIVAQAAVAIENAELLAQSRAAQEKLESRKRIERAKGLLMRRDNLSEEEAYLRLKKFSMDRRKTMREIAEAIIMVEEMNRDV
jgi:GAF domain-containing protein